jgi:serine protease Do
LKGIVGTIVGTAVVVLLAFLFYIFYIGGPDLIRMAPSPAPPSIAAPVVSAASRPDSFVAVVEAARPAVVNISTLRGQRAGGPNALREFLERYFGERIPEEPTQSLGSGVLMDRSGLVLTNNHVVEGARMIMVRLADERELEAQVVGRDPRTDLALLRLRERGEFPAATLGDSDVLRVGEWVVAIGNPFGLEQTVTAGIVSAKGRVIGAGPYDDFIQTDASINPGNSGGPLFNTQGEVVGITTAIFSQSGGSVGIGFAIPINLAREVVEQLKARGRVVRGWLGAGIAPVTPELARKLGLKGGEGALIAEVVPNGPAGRGGVRVGDVVLALDGQRIRRADELPRLIAKARPGAQADLQINREGKAQSTRVTLGELPEPPR